MKCHNCNNEILDKSTQCDDCGYSIVINNNENISSVKDNKSFSNEDNSNVLVLGIKGLAWDILYTIIAILIISIITIIFQR